jgi:hypothetical protein
MNETKYYLQPTLVMIRKGSFSAFPGSLAITQEAIVIEEKSKYATSLGLIGILLKKYFKSTFHTILPNQITAVKKVTFGLNKEVLELSLTNGTIHTIIVKPNMDIIVATLMKLGIQVQPLTA